MSRQASNTYISPFPACELARIALPVQRLLPFSSQHSRCFQGLLYIVFRRALQYSSWQRRLLFAHAYILLLYSIYILYTRIYFGSFANSTLYLAHIKLFRRTLQKEMS